MISIKISFYTILLFIIFPHLTYSQDSLIIDDEDYRLFYVGKTASKNQLQSKFVAGTVFVNIPIDTSFYNWNYTNPFSPSMVKKTSYINFMTHLTLQLILSIIRIQSYLI